MGDKKIDTRTLNKITEVLSRGGVFGPTNVERLIEGLESMESFSKLMEKMKGELAQDVANSISVEVKRHLMADEQWHFNVAQKIKFELKS